jgi:glycosyltransferase involved in cell wall biosynthesis
MKSKRHSSIGGFSVWHNYQLKYVDELHILAPVNVVTTTPKGSTYLDSKIRIHRTAKYHDFRGGLDFGLMKDIFLTVWISMKNDIDLVICKIPGFIGLAGLAGAWLVGKKTTLEIVGDWLAVIGLHKHPLGLLKKLLMKPILVLAYHMSSHIIVMNYTMKKSLINLGIKANKIAVIPGTTLDGSLFKIPELKTGNEIRTMIFIGRLSIEKGLFDLIESMKILREEYQVKTVKLKIIGDGPLRRDLEHKASKLGLDDVIEFTGYVSHDKISKHLTDAWLLVLPSLTEGLPKVVLEAMAAGRPVVATRVGGIPEVVEDGVNGFLVMPKNPKALAKSACAILTNEQIAIKMGRKGKEKAAKYALENILPRYISFAEISN